MNANRDAPAPPAAAYVCSGLIFFGLVIGAAAIITASIPSAILGLLVAGVGLLYFLFREYGDESVR